MSALMPSYGRLPVAMTRGDGVYLWDEQGNRYLDALGGIAVVGLGHANKTLANALAEQASTLLHTSNLYEIPVQEALGQALCEVSGMEQVFFCNSGAEANEACIKIARLHGSRHNIQNPAIIVMENSFHGRTLATLTATGNRKIQAGFEPLVPGFVRAPFSDLDALEKIAANQRNIAAVMFEPIQGEGGILPATQGYIKGVREICDQNNWLMIVDEIQTGMGRTGKWFAHQHEAVVPDVMAIAKALGNGVPIGACLAAGKARDLIQPGSHGTTFGGNLLASRAGLTVVEQIKELDLVNRAGHLGQRISDGLHKNLGAHSGVVSIRGKGLMIGVELDRDCPALVTQALEKGLLINVTAGRVVRMLPPYILTDQQADELIELVSALITDFLAPQTNEGREPA